MNVLVPIPITSAMLLAGTTVAEPAASETAWVSAGTYVVGDLRIRAATHREYYCVQAHTGRTALPEVDTAYWKDKSPTQRFAPFDWYTTTAANGTTSMTYVISPGVYFNAVALYGLTGTSVAVSVKDTTGGSVIYSYSGYLSEPPIDWYEYLFSALRPISKLILTGIPIRPTAELTITVTGTTVGMGMANVGDYRPLKGGGAWGGTEWGASAQPKSYSYIDTASDGTVNIVRRGSATDMSASITVVQDATDYALATLQEVLDVPVSFVATDVPGYGGLNVFGIASSSVSYASPSHSKITLNVKGFL